MKIKGNRSIANLSRAKQTRGKRLTCSRKTLVEACFSGIAVVSRRKFDVRMQLTPVIGRTGNVGNSANNNHTPLKMPSNIRVRLSNGIKDFYEGMYTSSVKKIKNFLSNAKDLIVIDPYLLKANAREMDMFFKKIRKEEITIQFIYNSTYGNKKNIQYIKKYFSKAVISFQAWNDFHDRVIVKDRNQGLVIGTSLNGFAKKHAFLLDLPRKDVSDLIRLMKSSAII